MNIIQIKDISKSYGVDFSLRGINLNIEKGKIFSLLGPNGAGKTTLVKLDDKIRNADIGFVSWHKTSNLFSLPFLRFHFVGCQSSLVIKKKKERNHLTKNRRRLRPWKRSLETPTMLSTVSPSDHPTVSSASQGVVVKGIKVDSEKVGRVSI